MLGFVIDTWAYNFFSLVSGFFLKNFEILTIFLGDFAEIEEDRTKTTVGLSFSLFFYEVASLMIWGLN